MRKIAFVLVLLLDALSPCAFGSVDVGARSAVLLDAESGRVLFEKNADERLPMASTTKIMTALLVCESGRMQETISVSAPAALTEGSSMWLRAGERLTLEDICYGIMLQSGNDAATAAAEALCGSTEAFSVMMNKRAELLGATDTRFKNPHGLDADGHYTTARDLAKISAEAMKNPLFEKITGTKTHHISETKASAARTLKNHNKLLWLYDGCTGIKTGYTKKSGRCLVSSAHRADVGLIAVTLSAPNDWADHRQMLDYGFENYSRRIILKKGETAATYILDEKSGRGAPLVSEKDFGILVKQGETVVKKTELLPLTLPVKKGDRGATVHVFANGEKICEVPLVFKADVGEEKGALRRIKEKIFQRK